MNTAPTLGDATSLHKYGGEKDDTFWKEHTQSVLVARTVNLFTLIIDAAC